MSYFCIMTNLGPIDLNKRETIINLKYHSIRSTQKIILFVLIYLFDKIIRSIKIKEKIKSKQPCYNKIISIDIDRQ
jgi:hypothetical protein